MTSFVIVSRNKEERIVYAKEFCTKQDINPFDITLIEKDTSVKQNTQSIGIDEIKRIQHSVFLKPIKSKVKAVIIEDAHLLTTEAQNALLKVLEEPPEHTLLLLGADTRESLLPTILSRCKLIELGTKSLELTTRERNSITEFIEQLSEMPIGDKLKKAELLAKDKDKATEWVEKLIIVFREKLLSTVILVSEAHPESQNAHQIDVRDSGQARMTNNVKQLQTLHKLLKTTNVNPRFAIETTLLSL